MNHVFPLLAPMLLATSCTEAVAPKDGEKAVEAIAAEDAADAVRAEKKSIEEAAEAAVKLVEEESRQEIEALDTPDVW